MKKTLFFICTFLTITTQAQVLGDIAQSFGSFPGFDNGVNAIERQTDGKILIGGYFTRYNGDIVNKIIRLNTDGSRDISFNTGNGFVDPGVVYAIKQQTDGKILIGGDFTQFNDGTENSIIRLNADGSKDTSFNTGTGFNAIVRTIALQTDGKIIVGGDFTTFSGVTENRIIRLNTDGTKDTSFNSETGFNASVRVIEQQADGKIIIGGDFTTYKGGTTHRIIRLNTNGTKDTSFATTSNNTVRAIKQQTNGKIIVGGDFTNINGVTENRIIRLNTDGTKDTSFSIGTGFNSSILVIEQQTDGKILIGGGFTTFNGVTENRIIRLNSDGTKDTYFITGTGLNQTVYSIELQVDGKILVGGSFNSYNRDAENRIIRLNNDGTKETSFNSGTGFNSAVLSLKQQPDGKILVGGYFTSYNGNNQNKIIRFNTDGTKDNSFHTGFDYTDVFWVGGFTDDFVNAIELQDDGKILVGGRFNSYNGVTENFIIRLNADGTKDNSFNTGTGFNNNVLAIKPQVDGKILVVGIFSGYNGSSSLQIIRLNTDGTKDTSFNTGETGFFGLNRVEAIELQDDGKILIGGDFTSYNGVTANKIIRLNADGTKDNSFNTGTGFNNNVSAIKLQADGKILVGGGFTSYNGGAVNRIIRLNSDGTKDNSFNPGIGFNTWVETIQLQTDGKILVGGDFTQFNDVAENRLIRLNTDGSKDTSFNTGIGFNNNAVYAIELLDDGKILVGGQFISYNGDNSSAFLIALHTEQSLSSNSFNLDKTVVVYPNPVKDILNLQLNNFSTMQSVKIYDLQGKIILEDKNNIINVSNLAKGLYIVKVETEEREFSKKFIKE